MTVERIFAPARRVLAAINKTPTGERRVETEPARQLSTIDEEAFARGKLQARIEAALAAQDEFGI